MKSTMSGWIGRLTPGEHHHLRLPLGADERIQAGLHLLNVQGKAVRLVARVGEADRAIQVAARVDLDQAQAGVLLVLWTQPAIERAAVPGLGLGRQRDGARLVEP